MLNSFFQNISFESNNPYIVVLSSSGLVVGSASAATSQLINGQTAIAIWGDDTFTNQIDGALEGESLIMKIVDGYNLYTITPSIIGGANFIYTTNSNFLISGFQIESSCTNDPNSGCTDNNACNYNPSYTSDDGSCIYLEGQCDVCLDGVIIDNDMDNDGVCDIDEIPGCMDESACNFNSFATDPPLDISLGTGIIWIYTDSVFLDNNWLMTDSVEFIPTNPMECNYDDTDNDGVCDIFEIVGCSDPYACNFNEFSTDTNNLLCIFGTGCDTCSGESDGTGTILDNDLDDDGVCDFDEIIGCTDPQACNYDATPTTDTDNSLCNYSTDLDECATCSGEIDGTGTIVDNDIDNDGVCNSDEIVGCTDTLACNYDASSTTDTDNSLCNYTTDLDECASCSGETDGTGIIIDNDFDDDGVCDDIDYDDGIGLNELVIAPIYLYPNPSKDFINLDFESNLNNVSIEILNSLGNLFIQENIADVSFKQNIQIAVHNLPTGLYLLRVKSDHQLHRINWIKN